MAGRYSRAIDERLAVGKTERRRMWRKRFHPCEQRSYKGQQAVTRQAQGWELMAFIPECWWISAVTHVGKLWNYLQNWNHAAIGQFKAVRFSSFLFRRMSRREVWNGLSAAETEGFLSTTSSFTFGDKSRSSASSAEVGKQSQYYEARRQVEVIFG